MAGLVPRRFRRKTNDRKVGKTCEDNNARHARAELVHNSPAEENSERMIVSMSPKSYNNGYLNSTSSVRTEFFGMDR
jgi:hypothetical protein